MLATTLNEREDGSFCQRLQALHVLPETVEALVVSRTSLPEFVQRGGIGAGGYCVRIGGQGAASIQHISDIRAVERLFGLSLAGCDFGDSTIDFGQRANLLDLDI